MRLLIRLALLSSILNLLRNVLDSTLAKQLGRPKFRAVLVIMRVRAVSLRLQSLAGTALSKLKAHPLLSWSVLNGSKPGVFTFALRILVTLSDSSKLVVRLCMLNSLGALRLSKRIVTSLVFDVRHTPIKGLVLLWKHELAFFRRLSFCLENLHTVNSLEIGSSTLLKLQVHRRSKDALLVRCCSIAAA